MVVIEADAERAGCFTKRQLQLGLFVDGAVVKNRGVIGRPVERTQARLRTRFGAVHEGVGRGGTAQDPGHTHLNPRGRG